MEAGEDVGNLLPRHPGHELCLVRCRVDLSAGVRLKQIEYNCPFLTFGGYVPAGRYLSLAVFRPLACRGGATHEKSGILTCKEVAKLHAGDYSRIRLRQDEAPAEPKAIVASRG